MSRTTLFQLGAASRRAKDFHGALIHFRQILAEEPDHPRALRETGETLRALKDYRECAKVWSRYLELRPKDDAIHGRLADLLKRLGRRPEAIHHYVSALSHNPANTHALMGLGDLYYRERQITEALACWDRLLSLDPTLLNILTMVGNLHRDRGEYDRALPRFEQALRLSPDNPYAIFGLADALRGMGDFKRAAPYWERMLDMDPRNRQVLGRAADCFLRLGRLEQAEAAYRRSLELRPDLHAVLGLARTLHRQGRDEEAITLCEHHLQRDGTAAAVRTFMTKTLKHTPARSADHMENAVNKSNRPRSR